jgi:serine/threonine-protein kinase
VKYQLHEKLGDGGFGEVFRAVRLDDGLEVAIKFLHEGSGQEERHRFEREVRLLQAHAHPHIMTVLDHDLSAARPFYVMPLMTGGPLTRWAGKLSDAALRGVVRTLVDVVATLHVAGGIHRDLKPDNIFVDGQGHLAVGDFGLGNNPACTVMLTMHAAGTPGYAAPELWQPGGQASAAADIFSLGATLFHLITGVRPQIGTYLDPRTLVPGVSDDLRDLVLQMVQRDPQRRPTATALCELLGLPVPRASAALQAAVAALLAAGVAAAPLLKSVPTPARPSAPAVAAPIARDGFTARRGPTTIGGGRYG